MEFDRDIIETFLLEVEESLVLAEDSVIALELRPDDAELMQELFRALHTVKGSAASLGFEQMAAIAHAVEELLAGLRNGTLALDTTLVTLILQSVDWLRTAAEVVRATNSDTNSASPELLRTLQEASTRRNPEHSGETLAHLQNQSGEPIARGTLRRGRTLRVDIEKVDSALDNLGEITVALGRLETLLLAAAKALPEETLELHQNITRLHRSLQDDVMSLRMVPVGPMLRGFIRTVRDVAGRCGKQARLVIEGADVTVDANVIERMREPLTHLVRNAIDHGIESPGERKSCGKDACGRLAVRVRRDAGTVVVQFEDDGAGLSRQRIAARARALGLLGKESHQTLDQISDADLFALVFVPGFSTAERVTDLSGRGVGMDVVKRVVESLHGTIGLASRKGSGTTITIRLPVTLALLDGFGVGLGEDVFLLPREAVRECTTLPEAFGERSAFVLQFRGQALPVVRLRDLLSGERPPPQKESLVVLDCEGAQLGLAVDEIHGEIKAMVKPMSAVFRQVRAITGCTILGSGRIALVIDVDGLYKEALRFRAARPVVVAEAPGGWA